MTRYDDVGYAIRGVGRIGIRSVDQWIEGKIVCGLAFPGKRLFHDYGGQPEHIFVRAAERQHQRVAIDGEQPLRRAVVVEAVAVEVGPVVSQRHVEVVVEITAVLVIEDRVALDRQMRDVGLAVRIFAAVCRARQQRRSLDRLVGIGERAHVLARIRVQLSSDRHVFAPLQFKSETLLDKCRRRKTF